MRFADLAASMVTRRQRIASLPKLVNDDYGVRSGAGGRLGWDCKREQARRFGLICAGERRRENDANHHGILGCHARL
jgi:hypothetical protein